MKVSPRSLEQWLDTLESFPLPLQTQARAHALAAIARNCSATELGTLLLEDPAAVLLVFREANAALARYEREAHGLEHAISLLGMARVQSLLREAPMLAADHPFTREYRQAQQRSQHAAWQARLWAEGSGRWPADEMYWDALLAGAPHWLLWLEAGALRVQLSKLRAQRGFVTAQESFELFGCDLNVLMSELAVRWRLPRNSQLSWRPDIVGNRRDWIALAHAARLDGPPVVPAGRAHELSHQPSLIVALANLLAVEADWDWYGRHLMRLLKIVASCCRRPLSTLINFTHQTAAGFSRDYRGDLQTPAARLACHWQQAQVWAPAPAPAAPTPTPMPAAAPTGELADTRLLAAALHKLQQGTAGGLREALTLVLDSAHRGIGLTRIVALLYRADTQQLQALLGRGLEQSPALRQLRIDSRGNALLGQILGKPVCLYLGPENSARYRPLLPESLRAVLPPEHVLLGSALAGGKPVALLLADNDGAPVGAEAQRRFRQLCALLGRALEAPRKPDGMV